MAKKIENGVPHKINNLKNTKTNNKTRTKQ